MSAAALVAQLAEAGTPPELLAAVAQELFTAEAERKALAARRQNERERKARSRDNTGRNGTARDFQGQPPPNERDNLTLPQDTHSDEASASSPARQPISEAKDFWNEAAAAAGWPTAQTLSPTRQRCLRGRLREHGIDGWRAAINRARSSPYLAGADPPSWFTFNWMAPASMNADQQALWLASAVEALEGIRAAEVAAIALEIRRSVTHHQKIVPEIARLVASRRAHKSDAPPSPYASEMSIAREGTHRRAQAKNQQEIEAAAEWERQKRIEKGLRVPPREPALSAAEITKLSPTFVRMGLKCGALAYRDGKLVNA
jgi:hypothetical protein